MKRARSRPPAARVGLLTVSETAGILGVSPSTLRLWESVGLITPGPQQWAISLVRTPPELLHGLKRIKYLRDVKQLNLPWFESTLGHRWYNPSSEEAVNEPQPARLVIVSDPENVVGRAPIDV